MANLFPIFLKLEGRRVLVVGAGSIAEQKLDGLLRAGADVHVVAPQANESVQKFARDGRLRWSVREFTVSDLEGAALVIAATGNPEVNEHIYREAEIRGVLCNAVDEPERCHFYYPAVVQRGDLQIAISTAGHSPALAQRIRKQLEEQFDVGYADWLSWLGQVRRRLFSRPIDPQKRRNILHRIARTEVYERFARAQQASRAGVSR
jgi:precorrin-2 dehydrogenase/sirohydrochlorin ferrochelatase